MAQPLLHRRFFKENPLEPCSAPQIFLASLELDKQPSAEALKLAAAKCGGDASRLRNIQQERKEIEALSDGDAVVRFMRRGFDVINRRRLCQRALDMQDAVMPPMLRRLQTSMQDHFVETAAAILAKADPGYLPQLQALYPSIHSPYAQSLICVVFAIHKQTAALP